MCMKCVTYSEIEMTHSEIEMTNILQKILSTVFSKKV